MVIVDSGHQVTNGYHADFYNDYRTMIDAELTRPAQAEITATYQRIGNHVNFTGQVKNLSSVTLSSLNLATIHGIVYEDAHVGVTNRYVRAAVATNITSALAPSATTSFTLDTTDLTVIDWNKLHYLVLVDYRPAGATGPFDMLQAAFALP